MSARGASRTPWLRPPAWVLALAARYVPFADAASPDLPLGRLEQLRHRDGGRERGVLHQRDEGVRQRRHRHPRRTNPLLNRVATKHRSSVPPCWVADPRVKSQPRWVGPVPSGFPVAKSVVPKRALTQSKNLQAIVAVHPYEARDELRPASVHAAAAMNRSVVRRFAWKVFHRVH